MKLPDSLGTSPDHLELTEYVGDPFWKDADADRTHTRLARRTGRLALVSFSLAAGLTLLGLATRSIDSHPVGVVLPPVTTEVGYVPPQTTTTVEPCIAEYRAESKIDLDKAIVDYRDCKANPEAHILAQLNNQLATTTTQPQS